MGMLVQLVCCVAGMQLACGQTQSICSAGGWEWVWRGPVGADVLPCTAEAQMGLGFGS